MPHQVQQLTNDVVLAVGDGHLHGRERRPGVGVLDGMTEGQAALADLDRRHQRDVHQVKVLLVKAGAEPAEEALRGSG